MSKVNLGNELKKELLTTVKELKKLTTKQVPDLAKEIVKYGQVSSVIDAVYGLVATYIAVNLCNREFLTDIAGFGNEGAGICMVIAALGAVLGSVCVLCSLTTFLKASIAPKNYAIEHYVSLVTPEKKS